MDGGEIQTLLGAGTAYEGKLAFEGRIRIDGKFRGELFGEGTLILGDGAEVDGVIRVGTLIVRGAVVRGTVTATELVEFLDNARIHADVHAPQLYVAKGVTFDGRCTLADAQVTPIPCPDGDSYRGGDCDGDGDASTEDPEAPAPADVSGSDTPR